MKITRKILDGAVSENIITAEQAAKLHDYLKGLPSVGPTFNFTNILYYLGGLIAIGAMTLFMKLGWESFGGWGIFFISLAYAGIGLKLTGIFQKNGHAIPAGICATFVVALTPLAIYGLQLALGLWPDESTYREYHKYIKWHWLYNGAWSIDSRPDCCLAIQISIPNNAYRGNSMVHVDGCCANDHG